MSRKIKADFKELIDFISTYSLKENIENEYLKRNLKAIHGKYYSFLVFVSEVELRFKKNIESEVIDRIKEIYSDIGSSMLLFAHGMYKQAYMSLRSSIENFIKAIGYKEFPCILNEKNVSTIFDKVKRSSTIMDNKIQNEFNSIKVIYSDLCAYVHTKCLEFMTHSSSFNKFPCYSIPKGSKFVTVFNDLIKNYLYILVINFRNLFFKFDPINRELIMVSVKRAHRRKIHQYDENQKEN